MTGPLYVSSPAGLDVATLYALLRLRADVFVVEQQCFYSDIDGRDLDPETVHLWWSGDGEVVDAYARMVSTDGASIRVGRVCTAPHARGRGIAARLVTEAVRVAGERPVVLDAQAQLEKWYERLGFTRSGEPFVEDGIPHVPMRRS